MYQKIIIKNKNEYISLFDNCLQANKAIKEAGRLLKSLEYAIFDSQLFFTLYEQLREGERLIGLCEKDGNIIISCYRMRRR
ncbi:hypothetical protein COX95_03165 [bacterium CG_4_10_14_0_2_um_filter_33_32]|nr:MAG: hypothetical protein AUJ93_01315 [bacterium CG2_30_33_46]PIU76946.1 MAG: hypothetical protein COS74_01410 [bacterium CG06_land_8_20_14_3_00_33_50]PIW80750.1 MAG: hypothetical protein COZ97_04550 [bacterium CG_4_8_14_3_um_filter_33_28]PIY85485.1 MAG: hypothetical protein COY76_01920 [bacterium CG_4_10_14_0_8_um_filter_33_57]PIZ85736.1 MAG: hypothetical protein COX95_03165 [bacterium CG_4_10_14_0_2_um_filter_33_32]PJA72068.1 MAG: hypothetical protein CO152_03290 [bacterium CG_4_9_14_3_um